MLNVSNGVVLGGLPSDPYSPSVNREKLGRIIALIEWTITNKRQLIGELRNDTLTAMSESVANNLAARYLDINVGELERILTDLKSL